jgi:glycosyltransferase involved in cell wall biosynthesis
VSSVAPPITFVSSSGEVGGAELYLEALLEDLGPARVAGVIVPEEGELAARLRAAGYPVEVVGFGRRLGRLAGAARLRRSLRRRPAAIVHANGSPAAMVAALVAGRGRPLIWMRHDRTLDGPIGSLIALRCARTVAVSHSALEGLGSVGRSRAEVVYPGVPEADVDRAAARSLVEGALGCPTPCEVIVLSGRLSPSKGQRELIDAAPAVLERRPDAHIALLGGPRRAYPHYERELRDHARRRGVADRVHFLGHWAGDAQSELGAVRFVAGCDLLVAPSMREPPYGWQEGFGLAVAEAMQVGTPVVAHRHGSLPEVLAECGELVPEGDAPALAAAIVRVLEDGALRERMSGCGRRRAAENFRRRDSLAAMRRVYAATAAGRRGPSL